MPQPKQSGRKAAPKRPAAKKPRQARPAPPPEPPNQFLDALRSRVLDSLGLVLLTRERLQDALDDAVRRGRMTRADANELTRALIDRSRREADDVLADIEGLLARGRVGEVTDRALREVDRARRAVGAGPSFPIMGYDDLTAAQVVMRLGDLTPAELRKVRDHERRHGNRRSVLGAIEKALG